MHIDIPHNFSKKEAVNKVKQALHASRAQILQQAPDFTSTWVGDTIQFSATVQGKHITGTLLIKDKEFVLDAKLPLLWRIFEGRIEKAVKEQIGRAL